MSTGEQCRIKVVCRVRPINPSEQAKGSSNVVSFPGENMVGLGARVFQYDHVMKPTCTQQDMYSLAARPLVIDVLSGYNATIFAYGQTSSGKTHTMEGELSDPAMHGIIPRIVQDIFEHIYSMDANLEIHIKVAYFEIYMDRIRDLLDVSKINLPIGETKNRVPYVKGVTERFVTTPEEVLSVLEEGKSGRHVSVTNMNAHSSRSHAVFLISIKQENKETRKTLTGKLYLVDLAGSEKVDKTNAWGLTLDEAKTINKSLLSLSNVISALAEGNKPFIPYRDSKLTRVLQESLGGNARTTLIICCSPSSFNEHETKTTLMFGDRAKTIKNKVAVNVELTAEEWRRRFEKERANNQKLRALVERCEAELVRWRAGQSVPEAEQSSLRLKDIAAAPPASDSLSPLPVQQVSAPVTPTPTETRVFEEERTKLYQQLDEKDEELQSQLEMMEQLTLRLQEMEESLESSQQENTSLKKQISIIEQEMVNSQDEVHEVMQALEELAVSYDSKDREIESTHTEKNILQQEVEQLQQSVEEKIRELSELQESSQSERRKKQEMLSSLFRELREVGSVLGTKSEERLRTIDSSSDITDEDFAKARIHLSNMRCEARTLTEQRDILEQAEREAKDRAQAAMKELASSRLKISQFETYNESLQASLRDSDLRKQQLEHSLSQLNGQLMALKTREQTLLASEFGHEQEEAGLLHSANKVKRVLHEQLERHHHEHDYEVEELKMAIEAKAAQVAQMMEQYRQQMAEVEALRGELSQLQENYDQERERYSKVHVKMQIKEKIQHDLGGLTDTVSSELHRLSQLRQAYLKQMTLRVKSKSLDRDHVALTPDQRELRFLEKNLEELTRAHKKTISENAELHREMPRLHAILASKSKRIGELEHHLRETKETASREYERLKAENDQLEKSFMAKLHEKERENLYGAKVVKRPSGPTLARPVPRKGSDASSFRDVLLAGAGVSIIGSRKKPHQLNTELDSSGGAESRTSKYGVFILAFIGITCALLWHVVLWPQNINFIPADT